MPSSDPNPRALARRLVESAPASSEGSKAAAAHSACERLYDELMRWTGANGCNALFRRGASIAWTAHPQLKRVEIRPDVRPHFDGIELLLESIGPDATGAALESVLESVLEHLGRFIGDDLVVTIVDRVVSHPDSLDELGHTEEAR